MASKREQKTFDREWRRLELTGACDGFGGMEYRRVSEEWSDAGAPADIDRFIYRRANIGSSGNEPVLPEGWHP